MRVVGYRFSKNIISLKLVVIQWYTMKDHNGEEIKFQSKDWAEKLEDEEFKDYCYQLICDKIILKYNKAEIGIDDVEITDEVLGE